MESNPAPPSSAAAAAALRKIRQVLPQAMLREAEHVSLKMEALGGRARGGGDPKRFLSEIEGLLKRLEDSAAERRARLARRPSVRYPGELPISARAQDIIRAVKQHPVVIVSGETGCGKSTQIPKMCLEAGRGISGRIACTQPRRIAAVTIAHRIAEELGEGLGRSVGYKIRFQDQAPRSAFVKVLTDGMLLAETQADRRLYEYDTLIIDEAHERSLNIDFLLGLARTLIDVRPELKVIITSATLDTEKFSEAFGGAPVIAVKGRLYPVEVEYRPPDPDKGEEEDGYVDLAVQAVQYLRSEKPAGDILVFMPTEQDILETCRLLEGKKYPGTSVLPLYARLPGGQQGRVYTVTGPKIVVATNVAETSLTIPGIKYVVDTGLARISQYLPGTRVNSLPISPVSRSSADQRRGRCGRVQAGLCLRLYPEKDYEARPRFTPPEIFRSNLAEVILRMIDLRLGDPLRFPFVDRPSVRMVKDGYETLVELGALRKEGQDYALTETGRLMARMPLDPRVSRMLLEARREGCLGPVAVIASALSIRDPRERPPEKAAEADSKQAVFNHPDSDFLTILNIWNRFHGAFEKLDTQSRKRRFCREHFLSFPRMQEWTLIHGQVLEILDELRLPPAKERGQPAGEKALYDAVHRSVLSGLLSNIAARKEKNLFTAAKSREAMLFPGSTLFNKPPAWIMATEMVKTTRLYARTAARIDPAWVEPLAGELCRRHYSEPHWDKDRGEVLAKERVTLFGLEVVAGRLAAYGPVNPDEAHRIFIQSALVEGYVKNPPEFLRHNLALAKKLSEMEDKLRRRNILAGSAAQAEFYSRRLAGVYDLAGLKTAVERAGEDDLLKMTIQDLMLQQPGDEELAQFPDRLPLGGKSFKATYKFEPGAEDDGVTVKIPHAVLAGVPAERLEWGVPGQFREKVTALIKGLPRRYRKLLVPVGDTTQVIVEEMPRQPDRSLHAALAEFVKRRFRTDIPAREWERAAVPEHLRVRVAVIDQEGRSVLAGRDLSGLLKRSGAPPPAATDTSAWKEAQARWVRTGFTSWDLGSLPESVPVGPLLEAYPGLEPADKGANLRLFINKEEARSSHRQGVAALLLVKHAKDLEYMKRHLLLPEELTSTALYFGGKAVLEKAIHNALGREVLQRDFRTEEEYKAADAAVVRALFEKGHELLKAASQALEAYRGVRAALAGMKKDRASSKTIQAFAGEVEAEMGRLMPKDFLGRYSLERLGHLPRYLKALELRTVRAGHGLEKDRQKAAQAEVFSRALEKLEGAAAGKAAPAKRAAVEELRWLVEEFKVSLFAPELRTAVPVSGKRLEAKIKEISELE